MKRMTMVTIAGLTALLLAFGPNALAGTKTFFFGRTEPGAKLLFIVEQRSHGPVFEPIFIRAFLTCPATGDEFLAEFDFSGFRIPIRDGRFALRFNDIQEDFLWAGKVRDTRAKGPFHFNFPAFDLKGGLQTCGSGPLTWKATGVSSEQASHSSQESAPSMVVRITKDADGTVSFVVDR